MRNSQRQRLVFESLESRSLLDAAGPTVLISIPQDLSAHPGDTVVAPVNIGNAAGVRGVEVTLKYDTALLDATTASVQAGTAWPQTNTQVVANVDDATGTIVAWVYGPEALSAGAGSLLKISFTVASNAAPGTSTRLDLVSVRVNEGQISPNPAPAAGNDSTDGQIAITSSTGTGKISGTVYADTNGNNRPDAMEALPGVTITLQAAGGQTRTAVTGSDGRYEFRDLAAGTYTIREIQPAACMDGGANQLSVTLSAGQNVTDKHFRELGLRPGYIHNRLFTTTALPLGSSQASVAVRRIVAASSPSSTTGASTSFVAATDAERPPAAAAASLAAASLGEPADALAAASSDEPAAASGAVDPAQLAAYYAAAQAGTSQGSDSQQEEAVDSLFDPASPWLLDS